MVSWNRFQSLSDVSLTWKKFNDLERFKEATRKCQPGHSRLESNWRPAFHFTGRTFKENLVISVVGYPCSKRDLG